MLESHQGRNELFKHKSSDSESFELIPSTQSLVERLALKGDEVRITAVHSSIIGSDTWFQIKYTKTGTARYFSCQNRRERDEWIASLKKTVLMSEDRRRTDNSLKLGVIEIKGLSDKNKYFAEIHIDDKLYARTASKKMSEGGLCVFWGEQFEFTDLSGSSDKIVILIHKDKYRRRKKKAKKPVGRVRISIPSISSRYTQEKWHSVEKSSRRENPSIRLKCQYSSVEILPLRDYENFLYFLKNEYKNLVKLLEPKISVRVKEELAFSLMTVFHSIEIAEDILAEIVVDEISHIENEHLTFRGNSIATKAMEAYIKLVGSKYLQNTLEDVIGEMIAESENLEIDPVKIPDGNDAALFIHQKSLIKRVKQIWTRISESYSIFPIQLQRCFCKIRQYLSAVGKADIGDNLISSCIFLRYLCPAILSPSLFHLTDEYPSEKVNRNLTLVAKTLQTLANFTKYEGKENSMEFLNFFLSEESNAMKVFLSQISSPEDSWSLHVGHSSSPSAAMDLGHHLSCLHTILFENISVLSTQHSTAIKLRNNLDELNGLLKRPTIPQLEQISQSTLKTLEKINRQTTDKAPGSFILPWSWTLPKKKRNYSHPAPHHSVSSKDENFFVKSCVDGTFSSDTSSSLSLSPSPGIKESRRTWPTDSGESQNIHHHRRRRSSKLFTSSMSLDDTTDSSDDSTYSSQCQSDVALTPRPSVSHTLPRRPKVLRSLSDYESEICELRSAMETLQIKLGDAERKLSNARDGNNDTDESLLKLLKEEDSLRREQMSSTTKFEDNKELMILMQQKKIAALDDANHRLKSELCRLGDKLKLHHHHLHHQSQVSIHHSNSGDLSPIRVFNTTSTMITPIHQETPKTVDELLDSLHSTPI